VTAVGTTRVPQCRRSRGLTGTPLGTCKATALSTQITRKCGGPSVKRPDEQGIQLVSRIVNSDVKDPACGVVLFFRVSRVDSRCERIRSVRRSSSKLILLCLSSSYLVTLPDPEE
jgi:hypothetical protein